MARAQGLDFGTDLIFTYGPFGFLVGPRLYFDSLALYAFGFGVVFKVVLAGTMLFLAQRNLGAWAGIVVAYVALRATSFTWYTGYAELLLALVFIICMECLRTIRTSESAYRFAATAGAIAAFALLYKFSVGVAVLAITLVTAAALHPRRWPGAVALVGAFGLVLSGLWFVTGQSLSGIIDFLSGSLQIAQGYSEAMGIEEANRGWESLAMLCAVILFGALAWEELAQWEPRHRHAAWLIAILLLGVAFKQGFVRHDGLHSRLFFILVLTACVAIRSNALRTTAPPVAVLSIFVMMAVGTGPGELLDPRPSVANLRGTIARVVPPSTRADLAASARDSLRAHYQVDPQTLAEVRGRTVHVYPWEATVAWAHPEIEWRPLPVMQSYSAYTKQLDDTNADFLGSTAAPERILRAVPAAIDGRNADFESPATNLAMLCNYSPVYTTGSWQTLERGVDRCGEAQEIVSVDVDLGRAVDVPVAPPGHLVYAEIEGLKGSLLQRAVTTLYKSPEFWIELDHGTFRLTPGTAGNPLLMRVPSEVNFPAPFSFAAGTTRLQVSATGPFVFVDDIRVTFFQVPIAPPEAV